MAQQRYHMDTHDGRFVQTTHTTIGLRFLQALRKGRPELFRRKRIKAVLQMRPSEVPIGELVEYK